jgi:hypothetical protein
MVQACKKKEEEDCSKNSLRSNISAEDNLSIPSKTVTRSAGTGLSTMLSAEVLFRFLLSDWGVTMHKTRAGRKPNKMYICLQRYCFIVNEWHESSFGHLYMVAERKRDERKDERNGSKCNQ